MRRLIYCFDGTWNDDSGGTPLTNVVKLHRAVQTVDAAGVAQISKYIVGIATGTRSFAPFLTGVLGSEVEDRELRAYRELMSEYRPGDEIYLFGFSRGAFEARTLANFIAMFGIGRADLGFAVADAWQVFTRHRISPMLAKVGPHRALAHYPVRIRCVGAWETVGNLGNPLAPDLPATQRLKAYDAHLSPAIDVALHALAIDEPRWAFSPTLWTLKQGFDLAPGQHLEQVWFPGSHADVGGGYKHTALSDIALLWMAKRTSELTGLAFDRAVLTSQTAPDPLGLQHLPPVGTLTGRSALLPFVRLIDQDLRALTSARRTVYGDLRTSRLPNGQISPCESIHFSALRRLAEIVPVKSGKSVREMPYRPRNLQVAVAPPGGRASVGNGPAVTPR